MSELVFGKAMPRTYREIRGGREDGLQVFLKQTANGEPFSVQVLSTRGAKVTVKVDDAGSPERAKEIARRTAAFIDSLAELPR